MTLTHIRITRDYGVYAVLALLLVVNVALSGDFFSADNLHTQAVLVAPVVIVALGMALVVGTGGIDLSVGSVMALSAAILPLYLPEDIVTAAFVALMAGAAAGTVSGSLVAVFGVQPIVATLAILVGGRGLAMVIADGRTKPVPQLQALGSGTFAGLPYGVVVSGFLIVLVAFLVERTTFGRQLVAIGGNRTAAGYSGLPVKRVLITTYVLCGIFAALASLLTTARLACSDPANTGQLVALAAITAVIIGGTPLSGGRVRVVGTVAGAVVVQLIAAALIKTDTPTSLAMMIQAVIIVAAVLLQRSAR